MEWTGGVLGWALTKSCFISQILFSFIGILLFFKLFFFFYSVPPRFYTRLEAPKSYLHVSTYLQCFYVERICKTSRRPTLRSRSETAPDWFFGVSDEFCSLLPTYQASQARLRCLGVFVQVVPHISECSPLINILLSLLKTGFQSKSNRILGYLEFRSPTVRFRP